MNSVVVTAYKCGLCNELHEIKDKADKCCTCSQCANYIGRWDKRGNYVHCTRGYSCDSFASKGDEGTYSQFIKKHS